MSNADFFNLNQDFTQSAPVQDIYRQGDIASKRAGSGMKRALSAKGFGGSTFADPLSQQAQTIARTPYIQQGAQTAESMRRQNISDFFRGKQLDFMEEDRKRKEQESFNSLLMSGLGVAGSVFGGPVGAAAPGFLKGLGEFFNPPTGPRQEGNIF